ncbi:MAG: hypothetical protein AAGA48_26550, partial [Myxococcota bacterium]
QQSRGFLQSSEDEAVRYNRASRSVELVLLDAAVASVSPLDGTQARQGDTLATAASRRTSSTLRLARL